MSLAPLVSVVVPCFNGGTYLERAIASVEAQSQSDWEIIVVDDGSDERGTLEILARLPGPRVRVVRQENRGLASARNRGVEDAKGTYLQFLDADDLIEPDKLELQARALNQDPAAGLAICDYLFTDETGTQRTAHPGTRVRLAEPALEDVLFRWERGLSVPIHCALFRRGAWGRGRPFVEGLRAKEDWVFWAMVARARPKIVYQADPLALYRIHDKGMCRSTADMMASMAEAALYLSEQIPEPLRERFRHETVRHLRANYAATIDDPGASRPLRYRIVDRIYAGVRAVPILRDMTRRTKRALIGRS